MKYIVAVICGALPIFAVGQVRIHEFGSEVFDYLPSGNDRVIFSSSLDGPFGPIVLSSTDIANGIRTILSAENHYVQYSSNDYRTFILSPDNEGVFYGSKKPSGSITSNTDGVYYVPVEGGTPTLITHSLDDDDFVYRFDISNDGSYLVYSVVESGIMNIYSAYLESGEVTQLTNGNFSTTEFEINPTNSHVVFNGNTGGIIEIYSVPISGGDVNKLNTDLSGPLDVSSFQISPDGQHVVFLVENRIIYEFTLFSAPIGGSALTNIYTSGNYDELKRNFVITSDSENVVFITSDDSGDPEELSIVPISGGERTILNQGLTPGGTIEEFRLSSNEEYIIFQGDMETQYVKELYSVNISDGTIFKLNGELVNGGDVHEFDVSANNLQSVYMADQEEDFKGELYSVSNMGGEATKLNPEGDEVEVEKFRINDTGSEIVYMNRESGIRELYVVAIDGGSIVRISGEFHAVLENDPFYFFENDEKIIYQAYHEFDNSGLFVSGSAAPVFSGTNFLETLENTENTIVDVDAQTAMDALHDEDISYSIVGYDAAHFNINSESGEISFKISPNFEQPLDFNENNDYEIVVVAESSENSNSKSYLIRVLDAPEPPVIISSEFQVEENNSEVGTIDAYDEDSESISYQISGGADAHLFFMDSETGEMNFNINPNFEEPTDADENNIYEVTVTVSDDELITEKEVIIIISNVNEPPSFDDIEISFHENPLNGFEIVTITPIDPEDDEVTLKITDGNAHFGFELDGTTGLLTVADSSVFDFEINNSLQLEIEVSDNLLSTTGTVTIQLLNVMDVLGLDGKATPELYPNPTSGILFIDESLRLSSIRLININGNILHETRNANTIDLTAFDDGLYILVLTDKTGSSIFMKVLLDKQ